MRSAQTQINPVFAGNVTLSQYGYYFISFQSGLQLIFRNCSVPEKDFCLYYDKNTKDKGFYRTIMLSKCNIIGKVLHPACEGGFLHIIRARKLFDKETYNHVTLLDKI